MISLAAFLNAEPMSETPLAETIEGAIHVIRGVRIMLDSDVARYFGVTTKQLNQALARNVGRFPIDFAFQLVPQEFAALRSQFVTSKLQTLAAQAEMQNQWETFRRFGPAPG